MKEGPSDLGFCAHLERIQSVAPCTIICHFQKHLLKVSTSNQRKGQGAVGRGNANQPPKEKGGKACHLLFLFVFDIFLWSVGEERTKASLEGSLLYMLPVLSPVPAKSREGHCRHCRMPMAQVRWSFSKCLLSCCTSLAASAKKTTGFRLALPTCDN